MWWVYIFYFVEAIIIGFLKFWIWNGYFWKIFGKVGLLGSGLFI